MPETPKKKPTDKKDESAENDKSSWSEDQKAREYYYDDAHGYETYNSDKDDDEDESDPL